MANTTSKEYKCISDHAEDLSDGRIVAPGDSVKLTDKEAEDPHNARLIKEGLLIDTDQKSTPKG